MKTYVVLLFVALVLLAWRWILETRQLLGPNSFEEAMLNPPVDDTNKLVTFSIVLVLFFVALVWLAVAKIMEWYIQ